MSDLLQPGNHPDADQLSAFAEHAQPEHERLETLAHLAKCPDCRQIVFLAQHARESQTPQPQTLPVRTSWLGNWHNLWPLAAALACAVFVVAFVHYRQPSAALPKKSDIASIANEPPPPLYAPPATPVASVPPPSLTSSAPKAASPLQHPAPVAKRAGAAGTGYVRGDLITNNSTAPSTFSRNDFAARQQSADAAPARPQTLGGAFGGPAAKAPPLQQQKDSFLAGSQTQTVEVQSQNQPLSQPPSATPSTGEPRQSDAPISVNQTVTVTAAAPALQTESAVLSTSAFSGKAPLAKTAGTPLPSRKPAASTISNGVETLAVDTEGDLFLSKDAGIAWQRITRQWTGKALKVGLAFSSSTTPAASGGTFAGAISSNASSNGGTEQLPSSKKVGFQLTTDTGTTWSSPDGLVWKHQ